MERFNDAESSALKELDDIFTPPAIEWRISSFCDEVTVPKNKLSLVLG